MQAKYTASLNTCYNIDIKEILGKGRGVIMTLYSPYRVQFQRNR